MEVMGHSRMDNSPTHTATTGTRKNKPMPQVPEFSEFEIVQRRDAAILRALATPTRQQNADPRPGTAKGAAQRQRRQREKAANPPPSHA